jgi:hypothetical protein
MPLNEDDISLIEKHIHDDMSSDEKRMFLSRKGDPDFVREVQLQEAVSGAVKVVFENKLRSKLKSELTTIDLDSTETPTRRLPITKWYWAAAAIFLIGIAFYFLQLGQTNPNELFATYYEPFPAGITTRDNASSVPASIDAYNNGDFQKAAHLFENEIGEQTDPVYRRHIQLLLGNCYLMVGNLKSAEETFSQLTDQNHSVISTHAEWYLALTALKEGKKDQCISRLNAIVKANTPYRDRALQLIEEINKI